MSPTDSPPPQHTRIRSSASGEEDDGDLEKLESDVKEVLQKIHHCRTTLPDLLRKNLDSLLTAHRPVLPISDSNPNPNPNPDADEHDRALLDEENQETAEKIQLLKQKISCNVSTMPILLKRMKECISRIDNLNSHSRIVYPAFKKRKSH